MESKSKIRKSTRNPLSNTLTYKQSKFVDSYIKTGNGTQSAIQSYNTKDYMTSAAIASENLNKPLIRLAIQQRIKEITPDNLDASWIKQNIIDIATDKKARHADRLKANELLAKLLSLFVERHEIVAVNNTKSEQELDKEFKTLTQELKEDIESQNTPLIPESLPLEDNAINNLPADETRI